MEEYCPIINPKDGKCYKFEDGLCNKGPYCNFLHFKDISQSLIKSLKDEMYEIHPEYRKNRINNNNNKNNVNKKRIRRHEHTSSESSLGRYDKFTRKRIIHRWNDEYISNKKIEEKRKLMDKLERHKRHRHHRRHKHYRNDSNERYKILIPGCGLNRLGYELVKYGYDVETNDYLFLNGIFSDFIFNRSKKEMHSIQPFIYSFSNFLNEDDVFKKFSFPNIDIDLKNNDKYGKLKMTVGDFLTIYKIGYSIDN